jgi:hypothetical protein
MIHTTFNMKTIFRIIETLIGLMLLVPMAVVIAGVIFLVIPNFEWEGSLGAAVGSFFPLLGALGCTLVGLRLIFGGERS